MGILALILIVVWLVAVGGVRGYLLSRRTGDIGIHGRDPVGSPQWWSKLISALALMAGLAAAVSDILGLPPFAVLDGPVVAGIGVALVGLGIIGTVAAQLVMGDSWRGDVDPEARTELITSGPYQYVRNPILTAALFTALGIALVVPNAFALLFVIGVVLSTQIQGPPGRGAVPAACPRRRLPSLRGPDRPVRSWHRAPAPDRLTPDRNRADARSAVFAVAGEAYIRRPSAPCPAPWLSCPPDSEEPQMIHPTAPGLGQSTVVRDGRSAPVTCASCGCRLQAIGHAGAEAWFHFSPLAGRDARGCRVDCADAAHDMDGRPALALA